MTLINKERLLEDLRERSSLDWDDEGEEYGMLLSRIIIDEQPIIEAIPVEWIENIVAMAKKVCADKFAESLELMIEDWREEQRKEE